MSRITKTRVVERSPGLAGYPRDDETINHLRFFVEATFASGTRVIYGDNRRAVIAFPNDRAVCPGFATAGEAEAMGARLLAGVE